MGVLKRGIKNAFRNSVRTTSIVIILGLSIGLALTMLFARLAVDTKIAAVQGSIGNTISVSPAGVRGFEGGGEALTEAQLASVSKLEHVTNVSSTLNDRLTSTDTNLKSAIEAGSLGRRFNSTSGETAPPASTGSSTNSTRSITPPVNVIGTTSPTNLSST